MGRCHCADTNCVLYRTDIEQETNGLYSFNREAKMDPAKVKAVIDNAMAEYYKATPKTA